MFFISDLVSAFYKFEFPSFQASEAMVINKNNQMLIPYRTPLRIDEDGNKVTGDLRLLLVIVVVKEADWIHTDIEILILDSKIITLKSRSWRKIRIVFKNRTYRNTLFYMTKQYFLILAK